MDPNLNCVITFTSEDFNGIQTPHTDALVVTITVDKSIVQQVLVDQGSSVEVMFYSTYKNLGHSPDQLRTTTTLLVSFTCAPI